MKHDIKRILLIIIGFYVFTFGLAYGMVEYTLWETNGKCEVMFFCICGDIGPGICDGSHEVSSLKGGN